MKWKSGRPPTKHLKRIRNKVEQTFWTRGFLKRYTPEDKHQYKYCILGLAELTGSKPNKSYKDYADFKVTERYPDVAMCLYETVPEDVKIYSFSKTRTITGYNDKFLERQDVLNWLDRAIAFSEKED